MASLSIISSAAFAAVKLPSDRLNLRPLRVSAACSTAISAPLISSPGSFYEVLGIQSGASSGEIKSAYRRLARILHPDVAGDGQKEIRAFEFVRINEAYEILSDPAKRAEYDRSIFRPAVSPYMTAANAATVSRYAGASRFSQSPRRRWETDQCW